MIISHRRTAAYMIIGHRRSAAVQVATYRFVTRTLGTDRSAALHSVVYWLTKTSDTAEAVVDAGNRHRGCHTSLITIEGLMQQQGEEWQVQRALTAEECRSV